LGIGCSKPTTLPDTGELSMNWQRLANTPLGIPESLEIWEGEEENAPLRAWLVRADLSSSEIDVGVFSSKDDDGRQSAMQFAKETGACVIVNGGYFKVRDDFYSHIGLLVSDAEIISHATPGIFEDDLRYPVTRAAIGFSSTDEAKIGWVSSRSDSVLIWNAPVPNIPGTPAEIPDLNSASLWDVDGAIAGGPALIKSGKTRITVDEEVFFGTTIPDVHPRTAAGIDEEGNLLLMIVDGRQRNSRGVTLTELSDLMKAVGAVDAINLDGGGSSTLVVGNTLLNRPTGGTFQREIVSAIGITCR